MTLFYWPYHIDMNIRFDNGIFIADSTFQEKDELKAAGFRWNPDLKKWWTSDPLNAAEFEEVADDEAKAQIEAAQQSISASNAATVETDIEIPLPEGRSLFPYQRAGVEFAYQRNATLIGDEMGLGKTVQAIALINLFKPETVLIVCPATLKLNWQKECNRWMTEPRRVHVLTSGDTFPTVPDIVVMNYDIATKYKDQIRAIKWGLLICDEAHYMKNPKAQRTVAIIGKGKKEIGIRADKKIFLTGTPITNRPR
jgi:SWI/SNF-related matrix-associated actin-dependent regulator 1 of chromatin subfamily A